MDSQHCPSPTAPAQGLVITRLPCGRTGPPASPVALTDRGLIVVALDGEPLGDAL